MLRSTCLFVFAAASAGWSVQATTLPQDALKVRVQQSFLAGETWLPAGSYSIRPLRGFESLPVLVIENDHGERIMVAAERAVPDTASAGTPALIFSRTDGKLILKRVSAGDGASAYDILTPRGAAPTPVPARIDASKQAGD